MKYKIAVVTSFPPSKGTLNEYGLHFVREIALRDDVAEVVVLADQIIPDINTRVLGDDMKELKLDKKIRIIRCWSFNQLDCWIQLLMVLRKEKVDGVIFNVQVATFGDRELPAALGLLTPMFARLAGLRCGVLAHNFIEGINLDQTLLKGNALRQKIVSIGAWLISFALTRAHYLTTTLDLYATLLKKRFPAAPVYMVPHGSFQREAIALKPFVEREKYIVSLGKFGTYKKLDLLLEAFDELSVTDAGLKLVIGGCDHPNAKGYLAKLEQKYAHHKRILFKGYIPEDEIASFFAKARIAVFDYSATTGSSGVLHQCSSYGTVPVYPYIGDFIEMAAREKLQGYYYDAGDKASMVRAIKLALYSEEKSTRLAHNNLRAVEEMPLAKVVDFHMQHLLNEKK